MYRWNTSHHYIVEGGYNFKDLQDSVNSANIALREETETIFEALQVKFQENYVFNFFLNFAINLGPQSPGFDLFCWNC